MKKELILLRILKKKGILSSVTVTKIMIIIRIKK